MQWGKPQRMKAGTPKSSGHQLPFAAVVTAVVMMKPQPMARSPQRSHPWSRRAVIMLSAAAVTAGVAVRTATARHPSQFMASMKRSGP